MFSAESGSCYEEGRVEGSECSGERQMCLGDDERTMAWEVGSLCLCPRRFISPEYIDNSGGEA